MCQGACAERPPANGRNQRTRQPPRRRLRFPGPDILITLVEHAGQTISKEQLIARTWPDTVVDDGALRVHVAALRKALGDGRAGRRFVANNPGRGYVFVAPVMREHPPPSTDLPHD